MTRYLVRSDIWLSGECRTAKAGEEIELDLPAEKAGDNLQVIQTAGSEQEDKPARKSRG